MINNPTRPRSNAIRNGSAKANAFNQFTKLSKEVSTALTAELQLIDKLQPAAITRAVHTVISRLILVLNNKKPMELADIADFKLALSAEIAQDKDLAPFYTRLSKDDSLLDVLSAKILLLMQVEPATAAIKEAITDGCLSDPLLQGYVTLSLADKIKHSGSNISHKFGLANSPNYQVY